MRRKNAPIWTFFTLLILAVFLIFVVYPLLLILYKSVINPADNSLTLENFTRFFTRKYYVNTLTNSFKLFDQNMVLNEGRPYIFQNGVQIKTTEMLALNIYNTFYMNAKSRGVGQAKAVLFFILVAAIALIQLRATHEKEVQQ